MVGTRNVFLTWCFAIMWKACSGSKPIERKASTGPPWNQDGISTFISPASQAQSAGDQCRSPRCGKKSCCISVPGKCPSTTRWAQRALGSTGRARREADEGRIVSGGVDGCEYVSALAQQCPE